MLALAVAWIAFRGPAWTAAFPVAPGGSAYVALAPTTPDVRLIDSATGKVRLLRGAAVVPSTVLFAPDGRTLAAASVWGEVCLWDVRSGRLIHREKDADVGRLNALWCALAFSPDGRTLAIGNLMPTPRSRSGPERGVVMLLDARTGRRKLVFRTDPYEDESQLLFVNDGRRLRVAGNVVRDYAVATGKPLPSRRQMPGNTLSPDGRYGSEGDFGPLRVWDLDRATPLETLSAGPARRNGSSARCVFSPDRRTLAVLYSRTAAMGDIGYSATSVEMRDLPSGRVLWSLPEAQAGGSVVFAPDGSTVLVAYQNLYEARTGRLLRRFTFDDYPMLGPKEKVRLAHPPASAPP